MQVALTGTTGFVGRAVVARLLEAGHRVRALVLGGVALPAGFPAGVERLEGTLGDRAVVTRLVEGAEVLVHLAAVGVQSRDREWARMAAVNVVEPLALAEAAAAAGVARVVAAGTCLEYAGHGRLPDAPAVGSPLCGEESALEPFEPYGATKAAGGMLLRARCRDLDLPCWYLRLAGLYGPGDDGAKLLPGALRAARARAPYEMSPGAQVRELLAIEDAAAAFVAAVERPAPIAGRVVNVGTGEGEPILESVQRIFRLAGADAALIRAGARPYRHGDVHRIVMDTARAAAELGWRAKVPLEAGMARLVAAGG